MNKIKKIKRMVVIMNILVAIAFIHKMTQYHQINPNAITLFVELLSSIVIGYMIYYILNNIERENKYFILKNKKLVTALRITVYLSAILPYSIGLVLGITVHLSLIRLMLSFFFDVFILLYDHGYRLQEDADAIL